MGEIRFVTCLFFLNLFSNCTSVTNDRSIASELSKEHRYKEAIEAYKRHISSRLADENRPKWENPYIYLLDIGDIYLEQGDVKAAINNYDLAKQNKVPKRYINDRYRNIATWYEKQGKRQEALKHLEANRERDPLLFDLMLDRISREMIAEEDNKQ